METLSSHGLILDHPASWDFVTFDSLTTSFGDTIGYLSTVAVLDPCVREGNRTSCAPPAYDLAPGSLVVTLMTSYGDGEVADLDPGANGRKIEVAGLPALTSEEQPRADTGADAAVNWVIAMPGRPSARYVIHAEARGPGLAEFRSQLDEMIASIRFDPPLQALPPPGLERAIAARMALASTLQSLQAESGFSCFPPDPNDEREAVITELPNMSGTIDPIAVTCRSEIEATELELWKLTLTIDAQGTENDRTVTQWVDADLEWGEQSMTSGP